MDFLKAAADEPADEDYCRAIEAYLCRKNDGHLIRIVGPAFERVCGWAERGVPLKVAYRGIDRCFERYYAKGPRRRPLRVEFCEADVLDVFDEWRRAVGVLVARERRDEDEAAGEADPRGGDSPRNRSSLGAHLDRATARLLSLGTTSEWGDGELDGVADELQALRGGAKTMRGAARQAALERLRALDAELVERARARLDERTLHEIRREAERELAPFRDRMPAEAYAGSLTACIDRIIRERMRLPMLVFE